MRIDILTLFPDTMRAMLGESILGRAQARGLLDIRCHQIRDYTENRQKQVDDYPYGGGWGQVMMAQPLFRLQSFWRTFCCRGTGRFPRRWQRSCLRSRRCCSRARRAAA